MNEIERLHHCYKTGIRFHVWYSVDADGHETILSVCPATVIPRTVHAKCDGMTRWGTPCPYSSGFASASHDPRES